MPDVIGSHVLCMSSGADGLCPTIPPPWSARFTAADEDIATLVPVADCGPLMRQRANLQQCLANGRTSLDLWCALLRFEPLARELQRAAVFRDRPHNLFRGP